MWSIETTYRHIICSSACMVNLDMFWQWVSINSSASWVRNSPQSDTYYDLLKPWDLNKYNIAGHIQTFAIMQWFFHNKSTHLFIWELYKKRLWWAIYLKAFQEFLSSSSWRFDKSEMPIESFAVRTVTQSAMALNCGYFIRFWALGCNNNESFRRNHINSKLLCEIRFSIQKLSTIYRFNAPLGSLHTINFSEQNDFQQTTNIDIDCKFASGDLYIVYNEWRFPRFDCPICFVWWYVWRNFLLVKYWYSCSCRVHFSVDTRPHGIQHRRNG